MRRIISVFLPFWAAERFRRATPSPPKGPILFTARIGAKREVFAVDQAAAKLGLAAGMPASQAQARVPGLTMLEAAPGDDARALTRLTAWCLTRISPLAAVDPPDGIWIDSTGCDHLHGGEAAMLTDLTYRLGRTGYTARCAVAETPGAAHALARYGSKPIVVVPSGETDASLATLPVSALRVPGEVAGGLHRLGLTTIQSLYAAPRASLAKRFPPILLQRLDQARGTSPEPIEPLSPPGTIRSRLGFPEPIATAEDLTRAATLLADQLCDKLARKGLGACMLDLSFRRLDRHIQATRVITTQPTRDAHHLAKLLCARIETIDPGYGIEAAMLSASRTETLAPAQSSTLIPILSCRALLAPLTDRLTQKIGPSNLYGFAPVESDFPERAVRSTAPFSTSAGAHWPERLPRPTRLLQPPRKVSVVALLPDHAPARFIWQHKTFHVHRADGPERVFGEWWKQDSPSASRDYFQVELASGQRFWLFRDETMTWYLHGLFG